MLNLVLGVGVFSLLPINSHVRPYPPNLKVQIPRTSKFPIRLVFLVLTLSGRLFFSPFGLMIFVWWNWASGYQTNLSLCFVGRLLPEQFSESLFAILALWFGLLGRLLIHGPTHKNRAQKTKHEPEIAKIILKMLFCVYFCLFIRYS